MQSGIATSSKRTVGCQTKNVRNRSMRKPTPSKPTMTHNSLTISQGLGLLIGESAAGMPGMKPKATKPKPISSADAAGSRPETQRGNQCDSTIALPRTASNT